MIIRDKPSAWQLLFILRGSILPRIAPRLAVVVALSVIVTGGEAAGLLRAPSIAPLPFSLMGIALSIFCGFRNSACYDRWWEGRKIWGGMVADTRDLVRQAFAYAAHGDPAVARPIANRVIAFVYAFRDRLRGDPLSAAALAPLAAHERTALSGAHNVPNLLLRAVSTEIGVWLAQGRIAPQIAATMEERVVALAGALAAGERIRSAPVPYAIRCCSTAPPTCSACCCPSASRRRPGPGHPWWWRSCPTRSSGSTRSATNSNRRSSAARTACRSMRSPGPSRSACSKPSAKRSCPETWWQKTSS